MNTTKDSMMLVKDFEQGAETFKLLPISLNAPFLELRFMREKSTLIAISHHQFDQFQLLPKLDSNGNPKPSKVTKEGICYERQKISAFYDYSIADKDDIIALINLLDSSVDASTLEKYFLPIPKPKPTDETPAPDSVKLKVEKKEK